MTEQELREKIVFCVKKAISNNITFASMGIAEIDCNDFDHIAEQSADALIAAGIGDVSEWKHRAEVAELVVKNLNDTFTFDYQYVFEQAEKELQEERKDD